MCQFPVGRVPCDPADPAGFAAVDSRCLSYDPALIDLIKERPMPRTPRASSYLLAAAAASMFIVSANLHVSAQRASQGVVVP